MSPNPVTVIWTAFERDQQFLERPTELTLYFHEQSVAFLRGMK